MATTQNKVILSGVPERCKLAELQKIIGDALNKPAMTSVKAVSKYKTAKGETIPGKFEIELVQQAGGYF